MQHLHQKDVAGKLRTVSTHTERKSARIVRTGTERKEGKIHAAGKVTLEVMVHSARANKSVLLVSRC